MAKSAGSANKVSFGKRKRNAGGKKSNGPKAKSYKKYRGQGR
jgi:hypothetical protein